MTAGVSPAVRRLAFAAALSVVAAYQVQRPLELRADDPLLSALTYRDFYGREGSLRWSRGRSAVVVPDPGPGVPVRVEVALSGWRPRGQEPPLVALTAGPGGFSGRPAARGETFRFDTVTSGVWRSDLVVKIEAPTFTPGPGDSRELGARIHGVRVVPTAIGLRRPPLGVLVTTTLTVLLFFALLVRVGVPSGAAEWVGRGTTLAAGLAFALARPYAALAAAPFLAVLATATVLAHVAPAAARLAADVVRAAAASLARGGRALFDPRLGILAVAGALGIVWAYRAQPRLVIDVGSGRETAVVQGFGPFDSLAGTSFRRALRGAVIDLSDLGGGTRWSVAISASVEGAPRQVDVLRAGGAGILAHLRDGEWTAGALDARAPFGWRSGLVVSVPGGTDTFVLRVDRVTVDRGRALPSLRILLAVVGTALLFAALFGAVGLPRVAGLWAAALFLGGAVSALASGPLLAIPYAGPLLAIVLAATLLAATITGIATVLARRGAGLLPSRVALAAAACGFVAWLGSMAFPLYRGGHFVFHSSIAEEIWKGRFLIYYLPYPGSMLSQQAQWGNVIVPHPCLYQALVSPLAALPREWFYLSEKVVLASLFASMVVVASMIAKHLAGDGAGDRAAVAMAGLVPTYQLLGLGHLMTILGVWASSLALAYLALRSERLGERRVFWTAVLLLAFCFLSYTAALLFTGMILAAFVALRWRAEPTLARALITTAIAAGALAFLLYYVNWAWPFLKESIPRLVGSSHAAEPGTPVLKRLALQPHKLAYSYGSLLIPLAGLTGLALLPRSRERVLLLLWAGILVLVCGLDVFFNFLLKHHYYVMVPVAVGLGIFLARVAEQGRAGRIAAAAVSVLAAGLGFQTALDVALGRIP